ncbi:Holliday junction resolvase RuvX [Eubacterium aggregans]|uniref:Holliday junction resolvase RuvX n=1 Tax=Eubacterium aggregans TaxID=81409 RepID=UPI003F3C3E12
MSKMMGLDVGDKYIGIAVSDTLGITAHGYRTYKRETREDDLKFFTDVVTQFNIVGIVAGLPKDMEGNETAQARKTRNYCQFLAKRLKLDVVYIDERLTSRASERVLIEGGVRRENRKKHIDTLSAQLILQIYLDQQSKDQQSKENETTI